MISHAGMTKVFFLTNIITKTTGFNIMFSKGEIPQPVVMIRPFR